MQILIAEDNEANRLVARHLLERDGHSLTYAENGQIAIDKCRFFKFDLILMDIMMPIMDGVEALKILRSRTGANQTTPVFALTAYCAPKNRIIYRQEGFNHILSKPLRAGDIDIAWTEYKQTLQVSTQQMPAHEEEHTHDWHAIKTALHIIQTHLPKALADNALAFYYITQAAQDLRTLARDAGFTHLAETAEALCNGAPSNLMTNLLALLNSVEKTQERLEKNQITSGFSEGHFDGANVPIKPGQIQSSRLVQQSHHMK